MLYYSGRQAYRTREIHVCSELQPPVHSVSWLYGAVAGRICQLGASQVAGESALHCKHCICTCLCERILGLVVACSDFQAHAGSGMDRSCLWRGWKAYCSKSSTCARLTYAALATRFSLGRCACSSLGNAWVRQVLCVLPAVGIPCHSIL